MANAVAYGNPAQSNKDVQLKQKSWKGFIDSLDWGKLTSKDNQLTVSSVVRPLHGVGVLMKRKSDT